MVKGIQMVDAKTTTDANGHICLFLDVDGTLLDFAPTPGEVHVDTDLVNRFCILFVADPAAGNKTIYAIRLVSYLMILAAIAYKNRR